MSNEKFPIRSICVYCGSQPGRNADYMEAGRALGRSIAEHGLKLVYGGGTRGIMGAVSSGVMSSGGRVTGIIPEFLMDKEASKHSLSALTEVIVTQDMHERKHKMFEQSDAFVTLPGGIGTLEEIVEIMTWGQLGRHKKPMVFANINGFWDPMMDLLKHMADEGFIHTSHLVKPMVIDRIEDIVPAILEAGRSSPEGDAATLEKM
ncbi:LOG family protein [Rhizobium sp.]